MRHPLLPSRRSPVRRAVLGRMYEVPLVIAILGIVGVVVIPSSLWLGVCLLALAVIVWLWFVVIPHLGGKAAIRRALQRAVAEQALAPDCVFHGDIAVAIDAKQRRVVFVGEDRSVAYDFDRFRGVDLGTATQFGRGDVHLVQFLLREPDGHAVSIIAESRWQAKRWAKRAGKLLGLDS